VETIERRETPRGELVLRRDEQTDRYEIISNGTFLMDTSDGRSERLLVTEALAATAAPRRLLIGGLGVGFSLAQAIADERLAEITVLEREPVVLEWQQAHLSRFSDGALADPRVTVVIDDLVRWMRTDAPADRYDAICLDIDNGPQWTVVPGNAELYDVAGLTAVRAALAPGGALAVWSAAAAPAFEETLGELFDEVRALPVEVARGEPDVVYLARRAA
jgi:spermidine synthase